MSHNFFSFLEPRANGRTPQESGEEELHTQPTPMPVSPRTPMSGQRPRRRRQVMRTTFGWLALDKQQFEFGHGRDEGSDGQNPPGAVAAGLLQFVLGARLWVCGQEVGSLSATGLGYWVMFDAFVVGLGSFLPQWLELRPVKSEGTLEREKRTIRRPYGNAPVETVLMFAQAVYLMFSSVYVCKETAEHILLSAGGAEGHHHHHGDKDESLVGIEFPIILAFIALISIMGTSLLCSNHSKLVKGMLFLSSFLPYAT
ncbi:hypothetical protein Hypma_001148 [Hypsizygus marmoreus]|uniref:Uncharacterized protein n=1 Tax=Hypsizygus marmoreus TaxID=39966 RepID=A0A369JFD1_HYPMA|nr:hypothetical protein Hypma_001148 [Hypsizygus marmoreus]